MADHRETVPISGELVAPFESEKAWHFYDGSTEVWLPKSLCEWHEDEKLMILPEWLAMREGLI